MSTERFTLPVIDITPFFGGSWTQKALVAEEIRKACLHTGFFYVAGHQVPQALIERLEALSRAFFALPEAEKQEIAMQRGGQAWRGYFPVGGELTSGKPDLKEGLYFGSELGASDPRVVAGLPLHGANLFPSALPELREVVLTYMEAVTKAGHAVMESLALSLGLPAEYFADTYTKDPTILFRIFHYPPGDESGWGVGEHTDYGLLTLLLQDGQGGLEVKSPDYGWIAAPPISGTFVCNIGDMLDRLTGGLYRSTPHRVRNLSGQGRLSFPLFFDPAFSAQIVALPGQEALADDSASRWDQASVHAFSGSYGDYLLSKVAKVFPDLGAQHLKR